MLATSEAAKTSDGGPVAAAADSPSWMRLLGILMVSAAGAAAVRLYDVRHQRHLELLVAKRTEQLTAEIAERRRAAVELEAAREAALHASRLKSEFLANVSHEIRTPMNGVMGMTDLALQMPLPAEARRYLEVAQSSADLLLQVIDDVLDFSKVEAGKLDMHPVELDIRAEIDQLVALMGPRAEARGLALNARVHNSVPQLFVGDPVRLRQILLNLVANALKFTDRGSVTIEVGALDSHEAEASEVELHFAVRDTGVGITPENQARIFDAFVQVSGAANADRNGTGLGLAIAARLVGLMGGQLKVTSTPGTGSTFFFVVRFPRARHEEDRQEDEGAREVVRRRLRILVADDNAINRMVTERMLQRSGHTVALAENGLQAMEMALAGRFDLVLMDVQMPGMDGIAATRRIRDLPGPEREVPIVAMTANVLPEQISELLAAGMNDHVGKPFDRNQLYARIDAWLPDIVIVDAPTRGDPEPRKSIAFEPRIYDELADLLGVDKIGRLIGMMDLQLSRIAWADGDRAGTAQEAHALVSQTGMLGFLEMSEACRDLEAACLSGGPIEAVLEHALAARSRALIEIVRLKEESARNAA
jgi:signal transduction histidine kinase/ActR/RegA family two-component response regulator